MTPSRDPRPRALEIDPLGEEPLFDERSIADRVAVLGAAISRDYAGTVPLLVGRLRDAAVFLADLSRALTIPCEIDVIALSDDAGSGVRFEKDLTIPIEARDVLLVEATVGSGVTLRWLSTTLMHRNPRSLATCSLLDRPRARRTGVAVAYGAFEAPDVELVGYGLGDRERYRALPALYVRGTWAR